MITTQLGMLDGPAVWPLCFLVTTVTVVILILNQKKAGAPVSPPAAPGARIFHFSRKGVAVGVYAEGTVKDLIVSGHIQDSDDYWTEGMPGWKKVSDNPAWH